MNGNQNGVNQNNDNQNNDNRNNVIKADILIVDDTPENLRLLSIMLSKQGYHVRKSLNGRSALMAVQTVMPDLVLLDIMMPEMDGYEVCKCLKSKPETADIPVIFLSALNETFDKVQAFQVGGADYVTKPFQFEEVLTRVQNQLAQRAWKREIQKLNAELEERVQERTLQLELTNQKLMQEISERKRVQAQLLEMALHDSLTGLPNRALFMDLLEQELKQSIANPNYHFAVLFLDCDRFKVINDSLGHFVGDELLISISHQLGLCLGASDILARLGGDEFAILLPKLEDEKRAVQVANAILQEFSQPFRLKRRDVFTSVSIGIVFGNSSYQKPEHILRDADTAMYRAKASGKARYQVFDAEMHEAALQLLQLETDLRRAIDQQEFVLHYQPIVDLTTGKITGLEALLRWQHPQRGLIAPDKFIPIAEETGLILPIGEWVLQEACQQLHLWQQQNIVSRAFTMSINLSVRQATQLDFINRIDQVLASTQVDPQNLKLEITESVIMDDSSAVSIVLQELRKRKIALSIDDFGTGYSSLSCLHSFPIDTLKIDRSFVQRLDQDSNDLGLIPAITSIARTLQMSVVAEGIETTQQLIHLRNLNCDFGQGYLFSQPISSNKIAKLLIADPCW